MFCDPPDSPGGPAGPAGPGGPGGPGIETELEPAIDWNCVMYRLNLAGVKISKSSKGAILYIQ